jgi:WD40 repeat protein/tRNA A-37 threonylcarbamoyl transferase component Bud32
VSTLTAAARDNSSVLTVRALERTCDRFEAAWKSKAQPSIEDYVSDTPEPNRPRLLLELVALDVVYRRRIGERPTPEEYRDRFPSESAAIDGAFDASGAAHGGPVGDAVPVGVPDWPVPTIPGYTVLEELGRGGMGVVFKATAEQLNRFVALKMILSGDLASTEAGARFLKEAEAVARLQHPQVVQIFRIGDYQGRPYLEMEYVEGGSLADRLDGRPWNPTEAARLIESLALAVHHAHIREIVHRDLKPANILLTADGIPKVTDFGLAKSLGADIGLTRTDSIIGSPSYMAPEQARGTASQVGPATDVYSLGAILYELLTGRPPFRAATVLDTLEQVRSADPAPPSRIQPGLPIDLETIVLKCLEKEPTRRYPSAEALATEIGRFCAGEPIKARPVGFVGRGVKLARRRPLTAALTILSAASMVLLIIMLAKSNLAISRQQRATFEALTRERWLREELGRANERLAEQQRQTQAALENKTVALEATSEYLQRERQASYFQRIALADSERLAGRYDRVDQVLAGCPDDVRGWEWRYLKQSSRREPLAFIGHTGEVWDAAISPDGLRLASAGFDHMINLWDVATGKLERTLRGHKERAYSVGFDKDGTHLVSASADKTAIIWDVASGNALHVLRGHTDNVRCAAFSFDGHTVVTGSWDGDLRVWDAVAGDLYRKYQTGAGRITRVAFRPDSRYVAVGGTSGRTEVREVYSGRFAQGFESKLGAILSVAFSPDGWRIATTSNAAGIGIVKIWDVLRGHELLSFKVGSGLVERVAFSPDGRRLATSGWDGVVRIFDVATGHEVLALRGHSDRVWGVNFSPSGDALVSASADRKILLWNASDQDRSPTRK